MSNINGNNKFSEKTLLLIFGIIMIGLIVGVVMLYLRSERIHAEYINVSNELAKKDTLTRVLLDSNKVAYERYSMVSEDLMKEKYINEQLKRYVENKNGEIQLLVTHVQQMALENQVLNGKLQQTSTGEQYVEVDTSLPFYYINARAWFKPPKIELLDLMILDSSMVSIYNTEEGYYKGLISHTNPFIIDFNAEFAFKLPDSKTEFSLFSKQTLTTIGISAGTGAILGVIIYNTIRNGIK